jgi:hypothetical protein
MFSLYYGAIILRDIYIKEIDEFTDRNESIAITVFVFNEVVVGAVHTYIINSTISVEKSVNLSILRD